MKKFKVISLGNIKEEYGWAVNDAHYTGCEIELESIGQTAIMEALKECGQMSKHVRRNMFYIDWESSGENSIYLRKRGKREGLWLWELRDETPATVVSQV